MVAGTSVNRMDLIQANGRYPIPAGCTPIGGVDASGYIVDPKTLQPTMFDMQGPWLFMALLQGGGYAEYAVVKKDHVMPVPRLPTVTPQTIAAGIPEVWLTAF